MKTESKHTPGPWSVPHFASPDTKCDCKYVLCDYYMGAICTVHVHNGIILIAEGGTDDPPAEEAKANAQLIAAAPELLAACQMMAKWMELNNQDDPEIESLTLQTVMEHAESAIAKAKGGK